MKISMIKEKYRSLAEFAAIAVTTTILITAFAFSSTQAATVKQARFGSPEKAAQALVDSLRKGDKTALLAIFGPDGEPLLSSGDPIADRKGYEMFIKAYDEAWRFDREGKSKTILVVGKDEWPFPIPIVMKKGRWVFDTRSGKEEILNRRIGRNEIYTVRTCLAIVDAQMEFAQQNHSGDGLLEYAEKFASDPGRKMASIGKRKRVRSRALLANWWPERKPRGTLAGR